MGSSWINTSDPKAAKAWAAKLSSEAIREAVMGRFTGQDKDGRVNENDAGAMIVVKNELKRGKGDEITCALRAQLQGDGIVDGMTLEGNEEAMDFRSDTLRINELSHAVRMNVIMNDQRQQYNERVVAKDALKDWLVERYDRCFFTQAAGDVRVTDSRYNGNNAVAAPTYHFRKSDSGGANTTEAAVGSASDATLKFADISRLRSFAKTKRMRPINVPGHGKHFVLFLHDEVAAELKAEASATSITWTDLQLAKLQGGKYQDNPIFTGALGIYDNVIMYETDKLPRGIAADGVADVDNTRRSVFMGAQAMMMAFGKDTDANTHSYKEKMHDYEREAGCAVTAIYGLKTSRYTATDGDHNLDTNTATDFARVVITSYAPDISAQF